MSRFEDRTKPILTPLLVGHQTRITPEQQSVIAGWACMKAMVAEYEHDEAVTTHHMQRKRMIRKQLPPEEGWGVWIGHYERKDWVPHWISTPFLLLPDAITAMRVDRRATYYNSHVSTQIIGKLFIQIIRSPMPNLITRWRFSPPERGLLYRIWPRTNTSVVWPPRAISDRDADYIAGAFKAFLERAGGAP